MKKRAIHTAGKQLPPICNFVCVVVHVVCSIVEVWVSDSRFLRTIPIHISITNKLNVSTFHLQGPMNNFAKWFWLAIRCPLEALLHERFEWRLGTHICMILQTLQMCCSFRPRYPAKKWQTLESRSADYICL